MAKPKKETVTQVPFPQAEMAVFYNAACDHPKATFAQIAKRVVPRGFQKTSAASRKQARKMFDLARK